MAVAPPVKSSRPLAWTGVAAAAIAAAILLVLVVGLQRDPRAIPSPLVGRQAPGFILPLFDGGTLDTGALRGKVVVVNFWASWCFPACYEEAPHLQRIWERYRGRGVTVVGVNIQDQDKPAREFLDRFRQTFPNGTDPSGKISIDYGVYGVPETFVVDRAGRIVAKHTGAVTEDQLASKIEALLRGGAGAP